MTPEELKNIAYQVKEITPHVGYTISGGEPLLNSNTLEYIKFLKDLGNDIILLKKAFEKTLKIKKIFIYSSKVF